MKKDNFTITLDKLNAIIPIFASEFCGMNGAKDEDLIMKASAYIFANIERYVHGDRDVDEKLLAISTRTATVKGESNVVRKNT